jgi:ADP-heptose:LPS heptosyltransferase
MIIITHWPRLFHHLELPVFEYGERYELPFDTPARIIETFPDPTTVTYSVVSNLMAHTVDYCSIAMMKRILPSADKEFKLEVYDSDYKKLNDILPFDLSKMTVVHPGRHWQSKTLPTEYWQEIINKLAEKTDICIIGKSDETRGTVPVTCPDSAIDLRNLLDEGMLLALLSKAKILVSNDSAPVHLAGSFDNWIVLFPTCKHPEHILPYRHGSMNYKTLALYKRLPCEEFDAQPTIIGESSAEFIKRKWEDYLLPVDEVIEKIEAIL